jgi:branched-chain amino acid aminotransferase
MKWSTFMSSLAPRAWKNGQIENVGEIGPSIASISFHMGTGVFDGMLAYPRKGGHHIFRGEEHFARFKASAEKMGLRVTWSVDELLEGARDISSDQADRMCYIRPIAYRGGPELWLTGAESRPTDVSIFCVPLLNSTLDTPMTCEISPVKRISSDAVPIQWKVCGLYANSFLARRSAESSGFDDGLMLDADGFVTEASAANVFLLGPSGLVTPSLDTDVFPGITRRTVLEICRSKNIACSEALIKVSDLDAYEGAFLCSTLMEIRPIAKLMKRPLRTRDDWRYKTIISEFASITRGTPKQEC